ncbi:MAG TPA: M48 family metalloprotease [Alphaproteobacteria bacterium]|jgi:predicted Zn-dependent protease
MTPFGVNWNGFRNDGLPLVAMTSGAAYAASPAPRLIRDSEIENTIRTWASPVFEAAGLNAADVDIYLVNDSSINAFVAGGMNLFINTGLLMKSQTPNQVIGVMAHETGHIAGGHLARFQDRLRGASITAILAMILGAGAAVAGAGGAGVAVMTGGLGVAQGNLLAYSRTQESSADQAGMKFLDESGQSARGMSEFFHILSGQELLNTTHQDPYVQTHPLTRDRIEAVDAHVAKSKYSDVPDKPENIEMHKRMVAKLSGFILSPANTLARYKEADKSVAARYARAIAYYRLPDMTKAVPLIDGLIAEEPDNPYFYELKGQMMFENGRGAEALAPYQKAVSLLPNDALLRVGLAQAQIERDDPALNTDAINNLRRATQREPLNAFAWSELAIAYGRDNQLGMSALSSAEAALARGNKREARLQGARAEKLLVRGSPGWIRLQDLQAAARRDEDD